MYRFPWETTFLRKVVNVNGCLLLEIVKFECTTRQTFTSCHLLVGRQAFTAIHTAGKLCPWQIFAPCYCWHYPNSKSTSRTRKVWLLSYPGKKTFSLFGCTCWLLTQKQPSHSLNIGNQLTCLVSSNMPTTFSQLASQVCLVLFYVPTTTYFMKRESAT